MWRRYGLLLAARFIFIAFVFFTLSYCLIAYIPFTYQQVIVGELSPGFSRLAVMHRFLFWPAFGAALATIWSDAKAKPANWLARVFSITGVAGGVVLLFYPVLPKLKDDASSLVWFLLSCIPLVWMAAIDFRHNRETLARITEPHDEDLRIFPAAWQAAIYVSIVSVGIAALRGATRVDSAARAWSEGLGWGVISHLLVFLLLFALMDCALMAARLIAPKRAGLVIALPLAVVAALVECALQYLIFPAISFRGLAAFAVAALLATGIVLFATGTALRLIETNAEPIENGLELLLAPFRFLRSKKLTFKSALLVAIGIAVWLVSARAGRMDWEFLLQKTIMLVFWSIAFAFFYQFAQVPTRSQRKIAYGTATAALICYFAMSALQTRTSDETGSARSPALEEYAARDISFQLTEDILRQTGVSGSGPENSFYSLLAENTNIPHNVHIAPVDVHLVSQLVPSSGRKPHIFIFVIDSLRRDYVSAYNPAVTFTPALGELAHDSVVFENAFTRYGGTGLSEPSIWVGGLMVHQQYVSPFAPMNSLQKLLDANGYQELISRDSILQQVVPASRNIAELDADIGTMNYDLCRTLKELGGELAQEKSSGRPLFVYTQPQNIHVSVINREGRSVPAGASVPAGFDAAYAARVQALDRCLGAFIQNLKRSGMYDNSIIIITSDHGDSLGEHGRWGHAYTLFPEIVRIPLIVHLPGWIRDQVKYSTQAPAFLTDITPTLYYLLGEKPIMDSELFGRPLFTTGADAEKQYLHKNYLEVSSYAPVYGLLSGDGRFLYIADGVNYRDYGYELEANGSNHEVPITEEQRAAMQHAIEEHVDAIRQFYGMR
jgi:hypothetical protein